MGLGGYLAARTDRDHYASEREREIRETLELPEKEREEVAEVFRGYGMSEQDIQPVVSAITADQKNWVDFMMRFELGFEEPDPKRARNSAATIAVSYILGGLVPLAPYMLVQELYRALDLFGRGDPGGALRFRLRERQADRDLALARRLADSHHRRPGFRRRLRTRPPYFVRIVASTFMPGRSTMPLRQAVEHDLYRNPLHDLDEIAGGVLRGQQARLRAPVVPEMESTRPGIRLAVHIHFDFGALSGMDICQLRLLEIGGHPDVMERHHRHQVPGRAAASVPARRSSASPRHRAAP